MVYDEVYGWLWFSMVDLAYWFVLLVSVGFLLCVLFLGAVVCVLNYSITKKKVNIQWPK